MPGPEPTPAPGQLSYLVGGAAWNWVSWQIPALLGIALADRIPTDWDLGFAGVLALLGLAYSTIAGRNSSIAAGKPDLGAASLSTIMQLISNGFGATLLPEMALRAELGTNPDVRALRFSNPEPSRQIGLAWRRTSPRKADFEALGVILAEIGTALTADRLPAAEAEMIRLAA